MNTNGDCAIFLGQVLNHLILSFLVDVCFDAASDTLRLVGLSQEASFAFLKTCLGIRDVSDLRLVLVELLKHLFFARFLEQSFRWCRGTVNEVKAWCLLESLFDIGCLNSETISSSCIFNPFINALIDRGVLGIVTVKFRSDRLWSLN